MYETKEATAFAAARRNRVGRVAEMLGEVLAFATRLSVVVSDRMYSSGSQTSSVINVFLGWEIVKSHLFSRADNLSLKVLLRATDMTSVKLCGFANLSIRK